MSIIANTEQAEYWTERAKAWIERQPFFDALLAPALDLVLERAALAPGARVIDIGCGTGASLLAAATHVGSEGSITGVDVSRPMLELARSRVSEAGLTQVECVLGDAQVYAFAPGDADHVISRFGMMFFEDPPAAFRNIAAALKPGGALTFISWAGMADNPWFNDPIAAAKSVVGAPPPPDPRAPGPMAFSETRYVEDILTAGGFEAVAIDTVAPKLTPPGSLEDVARFAANEGPVNRILDEMGGSEADRRVIYHRLLEIMAAYDTGSEVLVPSKLHVVRARAAS